LQGFYRKGHALEMLLRYPEALTAYKASLALENSSNEPLLKQAHDELSKLMVRAGISALSGLAQTMNIACCAMLQDELKMNSDTGAESKESNPEKDKFESMVAWLKDGGAQFPSASFALSSLN
jgi:hypothetical protein